MKLMSQVIISHQIEKSIEELEQLKTNEQFIKIIKEDTFLVEDAKLVIEKAYIASEHHTIIILGAKSFSTIIQNKLLKILEEPPKNKIFILITSNKSTILPTIRSRLPLFVLDEEKEEIVLDLDLKTLSLGSIFAFTQTHKRTDAKNMIKIIEQLFKEVATEERFHLDKPTLTLFSNSYKALDMGSVPQFILNTLLLQLLKQKRSF